MPYSKEQLKKVYQTLPEALKVALGSAEIQDQINEICQENGVTEASAVDKVYNLVMDILMGLVPPDHLENELAQIIQTKNGSSKEIAHRIRRLVLFPLKAEITQLHTIEAQGQTSQDTKTLIDESSPAGKETASIKKLQQKSKKQAQPDPYREPIDEER